MQPYRIEETRRQFKKTDPEYMNSGIMIDHRLEGIADHYFRENRRARYLHDKDWKREQRKSKNRSGITSGSCSQHLKRNADIYGIIPEDMKDRA